MINFHASIYLLKSGYFLLTDREPLPLELLPLELLPLELLLPELLLPELLPLLDEPELEELPRLLDRTDEPELLLEFPLDLWEPLLLPDLLLGEYEPY